jgi:predicted kinase
MIVSPDAYLYTEDGKYHWTSDRVKAAWDRSREAFAGHLAWGNPSKVVLLMGVPAAGKSTWLAEHERAGVLYFDATLDLPWKREPWIKQATEAGVPVEIVWLDTPLEVCIERNATRSEDRRVPVEVLRAMHDKILSAPPSEAEGATLTTVNPKGVPHG